MLLLSGINLSELMAMPKEFDSERMKATTLDKLKVEYLDNVKAMKLEKSKENVKAIELEK
jgi:hypothetical protein